MPFPYASADIYASRAELAPSAVREASRTPDPSRVSCPESDDGQPSPAPKSQVQWQACVPRGSCGARHLRRGRKTEMPPIAVLVTVTFERPAMSPSPQEPRGIPISCPAISTWSAVPVRPAIRRHSSSRFPLRIQPDWGRVLIVSGRWKGRMGYYDNDEGAYCIVYPDGMTDYVLLRPSSIVKAPER